MGDKPAYAVQSEHSTTKPQRQSTSANFHSFDLDRKQNK